MKIKKHNLLMVFTTMFIAMLFCACGMKVKPATVSINGNTVDLTQDYAKVARDFSDNNFALYNNSLKKLLSEDGMKLTQKPEQFDKNTVLVNAGAYLKNNLVEYKDCVGYREYGFYDKICKDAEIFDGKVNVKTWDDAIEAGFIDTGRYAVKLYADFKEVSPDKYKKITREYLKATYGSEKGGNYFIDSGLVADANELAKFNSGYGLVSHINFDYYTMLLNEVKISDVEKALLDVDELETQNPEMFNCFVVRMAACLLGEDYLNGKIKNFTTILIPRELTDPAYVCTACDGEEAHEWIRNAIK